jgi:type I restriction enzyme, S subunit
MQKQKNIPQLRFSEFKGEWEQKPFGKLTTRISDPVDVEPTKLYQQIGIRSHGKGIFYKELVDGKTLGNKRVYWLKPNALIVNIIFAWEQAVAKTTDKEIGLIGSHRFPMYLPIENVSDLDYLLHFFLTKKGQAQLELASPGGAGRNKTLGQKEFENLKLRIPEHREQIKIASFLTSVNKKISQLTEKKKLLEQYKKGMMQKIFSQELRFKDDKGKDFPKWEKKKLGEIARITTGSSNRQDSNLDGEYTFFDRSQDIRTSDRFLFDAEAVIVPGEGQEFIPKYFVGKFDLHQRTYAIMDFKNQNGKFFFYSISHNSNHLNSHAVGSTVKSLRLPMFEKMPIDLPCLKEQTKIATFLSAIDEKINRTENQIQQTEQYKKGLLQNMFC